MMYIYKTIVLGVLAAAAMAGCSVLDSDDDDRPDRTLPAAFELETVSTESLRAGAVPDSVNVEVYVNSIGECPDNAMCIMADGITVSEQYDPDSADEQFWLGVEQPAQFRENYFYRMSVRVENRNSENPRRFVLLGYTLLEGDD